MLALLLTLQAHEKEETLKASSSFLWEANRVSKELAEGCSMMHRMLRFDVFLVRFGQGEIEKLKAEREWKGIGAIWLRLAEAQQQSLTCFVMNDFVTTG